MADTSQPNNETADEPGEIIAFLEVVFYRTQAGNEPVREWLKSLPRDDRKVIGEDILDTAKRRLVSLEMEGEE